MPCNWTKIHHCLCMIISTSQSQLQKQQCHIGIPLPPLLSPPNSCIMHDITHTLSNVGAILLQMQIKERVKKLKQNSLTSCTICPAKVHTTEAGQDNVKYCKHHIHLYRIQAKKEVTSKQAFLNGDQVSNDGQLSN